MELKVKLSKLFNLLKGEDIPPAYQLQLLSLVAENPGLTQTQLIEAGNLQYTRQALNGYIKRLSPQYLTVGNPDPTSKRKLVFLTDEGRELVGRLEGAVEVVLKS